MKFWLGVDRAGWLAAHDVPMMISRRTFDRYLRTPRIKTLPRACGPWVLDSGGFTELSKYGRWTISAPTYVDLVRTYQAQVGQLEWAAPMDWMCEPFMLAKTGLTVWEHQRRTVDNFVNLHSLAPELPIIPVVQGWSVYEYERCVKMYQHEGIDLSLEPVVGVGSVCRRGNDTQDDAEQVIRLLASICGPLHGFGVSIRGLRRYADALGSSDSQAWSLWTRHEGHLDDCPLPLSRRKTPFHPDRCPGCAMSYRERVLRVI
jgi:hypothetical protein